MRFLLDNRKNLERCGLTEAGEICQRQFTAQADRKDYHVAIQFIELARRIDDSLDRKTCDWEYKLGECYEHLMELASDDSGLVKLSFCQEALLHYGASSNKTRIAELEKHQEELKQGVSFGQIAQEVDFAEVAKEADCIATEVVFRGAEHVIQYLMVKRGLLPRYDDLLTSATELNTQFPLQGFIPSAIIDSEGNTIQHFTKSDEKRYFSVLQHFGIALDTSLFFLLRAILFKAIREGILNTNILASFLEKNSWLGKTLRTRSGNEVQEYRWLDLILPALHEYIINMRMHFQRPEFRPNFVLPIDSLTVKIEGMLRDMCRYSGVNTTETKQDREGRTVSVEKDLHALLYEDAVTRLFDKDDLLFFRFLLVEHGGYRLRHKVAHALMRPWDYNLKAMHCLILAVLRIGRYDFITSQ